ncbi:MULTISPECIES: helix-turn-helix domain-containing protein [unclassified Candidatus Tisiphia]|uniref:helix-turn-helix domain-containing protein n=1 Tax=unclassified Candidatus Tisiphia TaxID=2996318 RepID=UPI00312C6EF5
MNKSTKSKERINLIIGMRLRKRRVMLGISQQELSEAINLSVKQIQKYEDAITPIAGSILYFFAKLLNYESLLSILLIQLKLLIHQMITYLIHKIIIGL